MEDDNVEYVERVNDITAGLEKPVEVFQQVTVELRNCDKRFKGETVQEQQMRQQEHTIIVNHLPQLNKKLVESKQVARMTKEQLIPSYKFLLETGHDLQGAMEQRRGKLAEAIEAERAADAIMLRMEQPNNDPPGVWARRLRKAAEDERKARSNLRLYDRTQDHKRVRRNQAGAFSSLVRHGVVELIGETLQEIQERQ